ncbi:NAD(P)H-binding protein [Amycolatopsis rubida]|uniref:Uncharacterized conserved protein YbjT, contains NAD(P)-binding and DUF2867 domains n=1 Tax=Amycolatopsis rubida TaxID=112413 RepID=A0A1I5TLA6_9PSEU|nr:NAD(P)H-binding protein [Amycolatopsis rubida]SFP83803.1 Uncharacterized conserved protein YbjT, contains NAD(P)-binding and DUF2867 domains [Amycolatopsis rubida]
MIVVFGATGTVGSEVVAGLAAAGEPVRAFSRNPTAFPGGVQAARGDLEDPASVLAALDGADRAFVLTTGPRAWVHDTTVADAARRTGTRCLVKLSTVAAATPTTNSYAIAAAKGEQAVATSGAEWTVVRAAAFMSNVRQWLWSVESEGVVYAPFGTIPRAVVDPRDVAAVAVSALTSAEHHGRTYTVTGPEALTAAEQVERLAARVGRPLRCVDAPAEPVRAAMVDAGMDPEHVDGLLASQADPDPARGGVPLPTVHEVTGRPPRTFDAWLGDNLGR